MSQPGRVRPSWAGAVRGALPGLALAAAVAGVATVLGRRLPLVGGPVFGILLGALLSAVLHPGPRVTPGLRVAGRQVLQLSIVLLGTVLSLNQVVRVSGASLPVMLGTLAVALAGTWLFGRLLGVGADARTLIGVGTGICGASAIAAVTAVIAVGEADVAYAIGTIFTFNIAAVLLFPAVGHLLGLSQHAFGLWSGTAINDTSSVVAAAYSYGGEAGAYGVVVKLTRTLMIIPICLVLAALHARRRARAASAATQFPWRRIVPVFLVGFVVASALNSVGVIPASWHSGLTTVGVFLITVALSGIGLSIRFATLRRSGPRPLLLGGLLWFAVATSSLLLQATTGTL